MSGGRRGGVSCHLEDLSPYSYTFPSCLLLLLSTVVFTPVFIQQSADMIGRKKIVLACSYLKFQLAKGLLNWYFKTNQTSLVLGPLPTVWSAPSSLIAISLFYRNLTSIYCPVAFSLQPSGSIDLSFSGCSFADGHKATSSLYDLGQRTSVVPPRL